MCSEEYEESSEVLPGEVELQRAWAAIQLKKFDAAVEWAARSIAADPEDSDAFKFLSIGFQGLGKHEDAIRAADDGLALSPEDAWLHRLRAISLQSLGKQDEALDAAREAIRLEPEDDVAHYAIALAYNELGKHGMARESARKALELDPDDNDYHRLLGDLHLELDPREAERYYRQALALEPVDAIALNNLGVVLDARKKDVEAAMAFKAALILDPDLKEAKRNVHLSVGNLKKFTTYSGIGIIIALAVGYKTLVRLGRVWLETIRDDPGQILLPVSIVLGVSTVAGSILLIKYLLWRKKIAGIEEKDPQLFEIYNKLERDRKLGRL